MRTITVKNPIGVDYDIIIDGDFKGLAAAVLRALPDAGRKKVCIVSDSKVAPLYSEAVREALSECFSRVDVFTFPMGEEHKQLDTVKDLYTFLIRKGYDRKDIIAALGGGVTGDLCGFGAATYLRGIDFIQIPTSLLAQVDSSIGGKTGVDFDSYKNMVGAFHMPRLVYMNTGALATLDERQFSCGMAEIIKHGLIRDASYLEYIEGNRESIISKDPEILKELIHRSCLIKGAVVEEDPKEQGVRALLNFGHTLGHAIEKYMDFSLLHGECVALGCVAGAIISGDRGLISDGDVSRIRSVFEAFGLCTDLARVCSGARVCDDVMACDGARSCDAEKASAVSDTDAFTDSIVSITASDKKAVSGRVRFILLHAIGEAFVDSSVTGEEMKNSLLRMMGR